MLHKLCEFNVPTEDLINIYILFVRSRLEQSAVVWHSSLTQGQIADLERVQKVSLKIILGNHYESYENALDVVGLKTLGERRKDLCLNFAKKCVQSDHSKDIFPLRKHTVNIRNKEKYIVQSAKTTRLAQSAVPFMQRLLNEDWQKQCDKLKNLS